MAWPTMKATASASVSRTVAVVMVRRSALMQKLVRDLMHQRHELLGLRLAGQKGDPSAVAHAERGRDVLVVFERDILRVEKGDQPVPVLAHFAGDVVLELGQVRAFGLRHIEDVHGAKANQNGARLLVRLAAPGRLFLRRWPTMGARIWMPFSPFFTNRPNSFHVENPATRVAVGRCRAMARMFPKE